jgi:hypothetical protein
MIDLQQEEREVARIASRLDLLRAATGREEDALQQAQLQLKHAQDAQEVLQCLAEAAQQQVHQRVCEVVSSCLSVVFDDPYEFKIAFERKRGKTEARLRFLRRGLEVNPLTASGGGVVDVAAFALRVSCLVLHRPRLSKVVVLDEPMKYVSAEFRPCVKTMLEKLSQDLKVQMVMVTHAEDLVAGKVITL